MTFKDAVTSKFEVGVHEHCARQYETLADAVDAQVASLQELTGLSGFGGLASGEQLRHGFANTASDAADHLRAYAASARATAQQIRSAGEAVADQDQALSADLRKAVRS